MGGSSSKSSSTEDKSTKITTTTTTSVGGDIGLTGQAAVDLAAVIGTSSNVASRDAIAANSDVAKLAINEVGNAYTRFVGANERFLATTEKVATGAQNVATDAVNVAKSTILSGQAAEKTPSQLVAENVPLIAAGVAAAAALYAFAR